MLSPSGFACPDLTRKNTIEGDYPKFKVDENLPVEVGWKKILTRVSALLCFSTNAEKIHPSENSFSGVS
jgi:hypothetical protein